MTTEAQAAGALSGILFFLADIGEGEVAAEIARRWNLPAGQPGVTLPNLLGATDSALRAHGFIELADRLDRQWREELDLLTALLEATEEAEATRQ